MIDISIVIPVYNTSTYLNQCLDSVYQLDLTNKEIILINDGSTDNSLEILNQYKSKFPEVTKLINQENKGLSGSRNVGIKNARGGYIFFIDSDDFVDSFILEQFFQEGLEKKQDILLGNYYNYYTKEGTAKPFSTCPTEPYDISKTESLEDVVKGKCFAVAVWNKLYKKEFLLKYKLFFKEKLLHEDLLFTIKALCLAKKMGFSDKYFYFYRKDNINSITRNLTRKNYMHYLYIVQELLKFLKQEGINNKFLNRYVMSGYLMAVLFGRIKNTSLFNELKKLNWNFREKVKLWIIKIVSYRCEEVECPKEL